MIEIEENYSKNDLNKGSISNICSLGYRVYCLKNKDFNTFGKYRKYKTV